MSLEGSFQPKAFHDSRTTRNHDTEAFDAEQKPAWLADLPEFLSQIHVCHNQKLILKELGFPFLYTAYPLFILIQ